ncbi:glycosyltransferase family 2 protein [Methanobacterium alcaliphilum]|uniref:glycosyltransferase family 2 protein n=1 Tax=Methanobacterium alcaliphilum TaxID=392018 RepID=UPI00200AA1C9|nr:glycosyltransferase family 2 protein [Methanobacterium alcaliphilum]MCK9150749.1 glycosyltransferase family 2 protein [Methanobacterium alcaliphilum]
MTKIAVLLPAYNEEVALGSIILRSKQYADKVIVVDDGSTDNTTLVAELAGAEVITHPTNLGKGAALRSGFEAAKDMDIIVTIDADAQHNPDEIPDVIKPIQEGQADVVNGSRYITGLDENTPTYRRVGQKVLDKATNISSGLDLTDTQSGFRAFSRESIKYFRFKEEGFGVESEMLSDVAEAGLKIVEVEIGVRYDVDGSTKNPISHGVRVLLHILQEIELKRPLYYFTIPGLVITIFGVILTIIFLNDYLYGSSTTWGPTTASIMMTMFGTFMVFTGIILDSISRMFKQNINKIQ